jgi:hypothetical protein
VVVQVADRLADTNVVGGQDRPTGSRVAQPIEHRDALGWAQDHVEGWDGVAALGAAEKLASVGVAALEHAPYQRPGDSPWPDKYCSWSVASSRV